MKVSLAQINPTVGSLQNNTRKIKRVIEEFSNQCDIIVFPEMVLTGYPPQDLLLDGSFIQKAQDALDEIAASASTTPIIIGTIRKDSDNLFNTAAVLQDGGVITYRDKAHLPTYDVFDEDRYFTSAKSIQPIELNIRGSKYKLGLQVCEDLWDEEYELKVSRELIQEGAEILINISASPFHLNRLYERIELMKDKANNLKCYFIYCNLVGAQDELVFDGQSCIISPTCEVVALYPAFKENIQVIDMYEGKAVNVPIIAEEEQIYQALSLGVKDYFKKTGHAKGVIGLSGGIDSALTAAIVANALGADNLLGIAMPSIYSSDHSIKDAEALAENLSIQFEIMPIKEINQLMLEGLSPIFNGSKGGVAEENLQARIRGNILMATANKKGALLLNTGNKTETALGYCTMYGDMAGALAVISDLNKSQVYAVSRWINENAGIEVIPENSITKPPSAELRPGQVDPFDYDVVSPLVDILITEPERVDELKEEGYDSALISDLMKKIRLAEYKRRQAPPGIRISSKAFGVGRRYPIINAYGT
jgi:NAD+ synthase (glutamine-hydrolysing)